MPSTKDMIERHLTYQKKKHCRREELDRCGISRNDDRRDLRICSDHEYENLTKRVSSNYKELQKDVAI